MIVSLSVDDRTILTLGKEINSCLTEGQYFSMIDSLLVDDRTFVMFDRRSVKLRAK
jgi:hypothetical protein